MKKQVFSFERELLIREDKPIFLSLSKYSDCLIIVANEMGTIGSIVEGQVVESHADFMGEDLVQEGGRMLFITKVLFGSSQIQFYELLLRRLMGIIWEEMNIKEKFRVILNASFPVLHPSFKQEEYFISLVKAFKEDLTNVL